MKIWLVQTDDTDYDLYQSAVIIAPTKDIAEKIAWATFTKNPWEKITDLSSVNVNELDFNGYSKKDSLQSWHAKEIKCNHAKVVLGDYLAG